MRIRATRRSLRAGVVPGYNYQPGAVPQYAPNGPTAQFQGTISPMPAPTWDPYATPGAQNPAIMPYDPCMPNPPAWCYPQAPSYVQTMQRFMDEFRLDYVWMPGNGQQELGLHDAELSASFAIPFFSSPSPLLITPGFATNWWNGPSPPNGPPPPPNNPTFPPRFYEAYLDTAWNPQPTPEFGGRTVVPHRRLFRLRSCDQREHPLHGKGVRHHLPFSQHESQGRHSIPRSAEDQIAAGRRPDLDAQFQHQVRNPVPRSQTRLASPPGGQRGLVVSTARGEYGGDSWTINTGTGVIGTDYNDMRVAIGMEFDDHSRWQGYWEVGYAFEREIYQMGMTTMRPTSTVFVGAGLAY